MEDSGGIRSISRGLAVLALINRHNSLSIADIARHTELPYPTVTRIVQTLIQDGWVEREIARKTYRPTLKVKALASGYQDSDAIVDAARPHLLRAGHDIIWPMIISTRVGTMMMVRDSTHVLSPLTLENYPPGYTLPILGSASGKVFLAFAPERERNLVLDAVVSQHDDIKINPSVLQLAKEGSLFADIRAQGFAVHGRNKHTATPGKTSSIAVPVFQGERVVAALTIAFFASALSVEKAAEQFLNVLQTTAALIKQSLGEPT